MPWTFLPFEACESLVRMPASKHHVSEAVHSSCFCFRQKHDGLQQRCKQEPLVSRLTPGSRVIH